MLPATLVHFAHLGSGSGAGAHAAVLFSLSRNFILGAVAQVGKKPNDQDQYNPFHAGLLFLAKEFGRWAEEINWNRPRIRFSLSSPGAPTG